MNIKTPLYLSPFIIAVAGLLNGCGGSSSSSNESATITGSVYAAPVSGAQVSIKTAGGETVAGPVLSGSDGNYTIKIDKDRLAEALIVESAGGTYTDEATGLSVTAGGLMAYVAGGKLTSGSSVSLTPGTTIIGQLVTVHEMTLSRAEKTFDEAFSYLPDSAVVPSISSGEEAQLRAGLRAAAFSLLNMNLGLQAAEQFDLLAAITEDLADGVMDGNGVEGLVNIGSSGKPLPADLETRFSRSIARFFDNASDSAPLVAGEIAILPDKIGILPEGNMVLTERYKIERIPEMEPVKGKSSCTLTITNIADGTPATGLNISIKPIMYMAMHSHSTPVDGCTEQPDSAGTYHCTVYYLMPSSMQGKSMGFWELEMDIDGETVHFYPSVAQVIDGDTALAKLRGQNDQIAGMGDKTEKREYILFPTGVTGTTGNHTFNLFIATKENMMSYPAVSAGTELTDENGMKWTVDAMSVEISTDETNWIAATDNGSGHWSASGITGLTGGARGTLYVKLTINGEQKTSDGLAPNGEADYAEFKVTPTGSSMGMEM